MRKCPATQLSLKHLRKDGWTAQVVEKWNAFAGIRQDLFGCIDIVAVKDGEHGVLGIQTTSAPNMAARIKKAQLEPRLKVWLAAGNRFVVHGWKKDGRCWQCVEKNLAA